MCSQVAYRGLSATRVLPRFAAKAAASDPWALKCWSARARRRVSAVGRYVGGLAPGVAEGDLRDQFYPFGEIRSIRVRPCRSCVRGR